MKTGLARQLGLFGTTLAVMGGIIGAGIFINPYLVAQRVPVASLILGVWIAGGLIALVGGFIYAELAARLPVVGGQYAYLRDALHPAVAFMYGWVLLLVIQTGGMAAVAVIFARYFLELTQWPVPAAAVAVLALAALTGINCLGVRAGSRVQSVMTLTAIAAIGVIVLGSFWGSSAAPASVRPPALPGNVLLAFGAAMTPVLFAYGGWQTSSFLAGEVRDAPRVLPRAMILGVLGVIVVYTAVNFAYLRALGPDGPGGHHHAGVFCDAVVSRAAGSAVHRGRDCFLSLWFPRAIDAHRASRLLRDGGGWRLFSQRRLGSSDHARTSGRDRVAGRVGDRDRTHRQLCAGGELRGGDGLHLLRAHGDLPFRDAPTRS